MVSTVLGTAVPRKFSAEDLKRRDEAQGRVAWALHNLCAGRQRRMADLMGVPQSQISRIVSGKLGASSEILAALARLTGVNPSWATQGLGSPLLPSTKGTLPIAYGILPGTTLDYAHLLTGQRHPVAEPLDRETRYWLELQASSPLLRDNGLRLLVGDLLLMETDPAWTNRLDLIQGRLCGVRLGQGSPEPTYALGMVYRDTLGIAFSAFSTTFRLIGAPLQAHAMPPPSTVSELPDPRIKVFPEGGKRRKIRELEREQEKAEKRKQLQEMAAQPEVMSPQAATQEANREPDGTFTMQDAIGVAVYLVRPSPGIVQG